MPAGTAARSPGTTEPARLQAGPLGVAVADGRLRLSWSGVEVVRQIDCPIRDADWRTLTVEETGVERRDCGGGFTWRRRFRTADSGVAGELAVEARADAAGGSLTADLTLTAAQPVEVNRAGFILLHPIAGVAGTPLAVRHADGSSAATDFPARISPGQPVFDIAGLRHTVGGVAVAIDFEGETFEMEDQRNWTDASFKTYCRPLSRPRPYRLEPGAPVRQRIRVTLAPASAVAATPVAAAGTAVMPRILLAHEAALGGTPPPGLAALPVDGLILRIDGRAPALAPLAAPMTLEIVTDDDPAAEIAAVAAACRAAGVAPRRVIALPRAYLASHQPEGPWPDGPRPMDLVPLVQTAFPAAEAGGGMLTNFTEFNRCPPDPAAIDFATFGTTAIVHAADDRAVIETLEALPHVFDSARALVPGRPLHLGLVAIGMRSNPYGSAVAANPDGRRVAMAMDDPRQRQRFAGAFAIGAAAAAARAGVASFAPAMCAGPLGLGPDEAPWPLREAVAGLAALGGARATIEGGPTGGLLVHGALGGLAANLGPDPVDVAGRRLAPMDFAVLGPGA